MDDTGVVLVGNQLFRAGLWEATENELMIRVQADRDGALELACLKEDCSWEWDTWKPLHQPTPPSQWDFKLADLLRLAVDHECPTPAPVHACCEWCTLGGA